MLNYNQGFYTNADQNKRMTLKKTSSRITDLCKNCLEGGGVTQIYNGDFFDQWYWSRATGPSGATGATGATGPSRKNRSRWN
jgi:hypothetical protein